MLWGVLIKVAIHPSSFESIKISESPLTTEEATNPIAGGIINRKNTIPKRALTGEDRQESRLKS